MSGRVELSVTVSVNYLVCELYCSRSFAVILVYFLFCVRGKDGGALVEKQNGFCFRALDNTLRFYILESWCT